MSEDPPLLKHLEAHLGRFVGATRVEEVDLPALAFAERPVAGATALVTFGLSKHALAPAEAPTYQELLIAARHRWATRDLATLLLVVAAEVLESHQPLVHGRVLGPAGPVCPGARLEALLCTVPLRTLFGGGLGTFKDAADPAAPRIDIVQLVPISAREAGIVERDGHEGVLARLNEKGAGILDLDRASLE